MPLWRRVLWLLCLAFVVTTALPRSASADRPKLSAADRARADRLKRLADTEMESLRYAEALADYDEVYKITADPALLYNRARVLQGLERFAEALDSLEQFSREASPDLKSHVPKLKELLEDLNGRLATLTIHCSVPDARVMVRDKLVATTPVPDPIRLNAGQAVLEVIAEGYAPYRETIELPKAGTVTVDVVLLARDAKGQLAIASTPIGAEVMVDGKPFGRAPAEAQLAPGNHVIIARREGFRDGKASAVVIEGQRKEVSITLEKTPGLLSKWWFWTGVGAVVVGTAVVVITYALTTEKSGDRGDIAPGQVSGPLVRF